MIRICLGLDKKLKEELEQEAKENHQPLSAYIRKILYERRK